MEQVRVLIAIALSFLVFLVWDIVFVKKDDMPKSPATQSAHDTKQPVNNKALDASNKNVEERQKAEETEDFSKSDFGIEENSGKIITIDTPLYVAKISENGGTIVSFILKEYKESTKANSEPKELISQNEKQGSLSTFFQGNNFKGMEKGHFKIANKIDELEVYSSKKTMKMQWVSPNGVSVEKMFTFYPNRYLFDLDIIVNNESNRKINENFNIVLKQKIENQKNNYGFIGASGLINNSRKEIKIADIEDATLYQGKVNWAGIETIYFLTSIIPEKPRDAAIQTEKTETNIIENRLIENPKSISPGEKAEFNYKIYFGPKSLKVLSKLGHGLDKAINFGFFDILAKPCLWLMNVIHQYIPNYGVAIIVLTILIKILLWPLGNKSYKSMSDMKKLQPLVNELKEKHKDDKKKMNQELMALYKVYKINPMGGCLPMILQIPVFIAFYRMLYEAIELRHAPFFGWINDLSAPDRLFRFDFQIPLMEPPYGIPVLTLIMGATMFIQQKMTPAPGDASQAKIMMFMPIIFTVIFVNFSSGLVLYWLVNNILSIAQQYYVYNKKS